VITGAVFAVLAVTVPVGASLPALLFVSALGVLLARIDVRVHRLPDALVLPSYPIAATCLAAASWARQDWPALLRAGIATITILAVFLALAMASSFGLGDVKLAGLLAMTLGWHGWMLVATFVLAAFILGAAAALALLATRRATRTSQMPFGPTLLTGALLAVLIAPSPTL
jgi:leader peptidase (prepilin peptidase)/N-methyltransferase